MVRHLPRSVPVVVGRVDAVTGADVWRFELSPTAFGGVDFAVDGTSLRVVVEHDDGSAPPRRLYVFDFDPRTGVARWASQFSPDIREQHLFSTESSLALVPAGFNIRISTTSLAYVLDTSDGAVERMFKLQTTPATAAPSAPTGPTSPSGDLMESITLPQGIVASAGSTVALVRESDNAVHGPIIYSLTGGLGECVAPRRAADAPIRDDQHDADTTPWRVGAIRRDR